MSDYQGLKYGAVQFPLPVGASALGGPGATLLRSADPPLFYLLEFYKFLLEFHLGARFLAEVASGGVEQIESMVAETLPLNPEAFLVEEHLRFPLLAAYRKSTKFQFIGRQKHKVDDVEVAYVLPPLQAGQAERLLPILNAVVALLDNRTEQGFDPSYTPTEPTGAAGDPFWKRAGLVSAGVTGATYGGYAPTDGLYFPAVILSVELKERSDPDFTEFEESAGASATIDVQDPSDGTVVEDLAQLSYDSDYLTTEGDDPATTEGLDNLRPED